MKTAILLATHNSEKYLAAQIDSLLAQTVKDNVIIVSDDGSSDSTRDILKKYGVDVLEHEPLGSAQANFMYLINNAPDADYYMFCDHDDVWFPEKVSKTIKKMLEIENGRPALVHGDLCVTDGNLNKTADSLFDVQQLSREQDLAHTLIQNNVTGCTVMINDALRRLAMKKTDACDIVMHDWFLAILANACGNVGFVDEPLMYYRQHSGNEIGAKNASSAKYIIGRAKSKNNGKIFTDTFDQAKMIAELYENELGENLDTVKAFAQMADMTKIQKLKNCARYGFWKNTLVRRIGQIIFI